jgi:repressor LexA
MRARFASSPNFRYKLGRVVLWRTVMFLTKRQKEFYDFLQAYIRAHGYAPTFQEIGRHFRLSSLATVHKHLSNLEGKGLIRRHWNYSRAIELVAPKGQHGSVALPLLGQVAAGRPIEAVEADDTLQVPEAFVGRGKTYALRVRGDSMIEDGILDGDFIIVEERADAENGRTVVALVNGEATVKRMHRERGMIRLQPANASMPPILARAKDVIIRGVVVAVMRKY